MSLSYAEAILALENVNSIDDIELLKNIISQLDVTASGSVTVLYSGRIGEVEFDELGKVITTSGESAADLVDSLKSNPDFRIINKTAAADFLDVFSVEPNELLIEKLTMIFGIDPNDSVAPNNLALEFLFK